MWYYNNKILNSIEELPNPEFLKGFIYRISSIDTGKWYIGKKSFFSKTKKALTKKEISCDKRLKAYKHVIKESDWRKYYGSNATLKADVLTHGPTAFKREIIALAYSTKELTFLEFEYQIKYNVLRKENCYNDNIAGKFFRRDLKQN